MLGDVKEEKEVKEEDGVKEEGEGEGEGGSDDDDDEEGEGGTSKDDVGFLYERSAGGGLGAALEMARGRGMLLDETETSGRMFDQKGAGLHNYKEEGDDKDSLNLQYYDEFGRKMTQKQARPAQMRAVDVTPPRTRHVPAARACLACRAPLRAPRACPSHAACHVSRRRSDSSRGSSTARLRRRSGAKSECSRWSARWLSSRRTTRWTT